MDKKETKKDPESLIRPSGTFSKRRREMDAIYFAAFSGGYVDLAVALL
jgi:hypothetical protein